MFVHNNIHDCKSNPCKQKRGDARLTTHPDTPSALSGGVPMQANSTTTGFMTAPQRQISGNLVRALSPTFNDHWSQPRLFLNSLTQPEQQILVNAIRFETSNVKSAVVRQNILNQLNMISNDLAVRVSTALGLTAPGPNPAFYHDNVTQGVNIFGVPLPTVATLTVGILATTANPTSIQQAQALQARFAQDGVVASIVGEVQAPGINQTYSQSDASNFDGLIVAQGAETLFSPFQSSTLFPLGRPAQLLLDSYRWGKPVGAMGSGSAAFTQVGVPTTPGVFLTNATGDANAMVTQFEGGLSQFKFLDRFPIDQGAAPGAPASVVQQSQADQAQVEQQEAVASQVAPSSGVRFVPASGAGGVLMVLAGLAVIMA